MSMLQEQEEIRQSPVRESDSGVGPFQGPAKTMFFMGLFAGIAICTSVMLVYVVWSVTSGKGILSAGSQVATAVQPTANQPTADQPTANQPTTPSAPIPAVNEKTDHILGPSNAKITLIEYSDFQCPYCIRHYATIKQVMDAYKDKIRLVYRHYPLTEIHPNAQKAAEASECAADLGGNDAFWKIYDKIFTADDISVPSLKSIAKGLGLNEAKFNDCLDSGKMAAKVKAEADAGAQSGVQGTPANFINGQEVPGGAQPFSKFQQIIDGILKG